jgi:prephenate dehydratase
MQNSDAGFVPDTMMILTYRLPLFVTGIADLPIRFSLYRLNDDHSPLTQVLSHPVALTQCDAWIQERGVRTIQVHSTAEGPSMVASQRLSGLGAIAPSGQSKFFGLKETEVDLQGPHPNRTRFVRLERRQSDEKQVRRIVAGAEGAVSMANLLASKVLAAVGSVEIGAFKSANGLGAFSYVLHAELKRPMPSKTLLKAGFGKGAWLIGWTG